MIRSYSSSRVTARTQSRSLNPNPGLSAKHLYSVGLHMGVEGEHLMELMAIGKFYIVLLNGKTQLLNY